MTGRHQAVNARDEARTRVRRATGIFVAASVTAAGVVAAYVAGNASGHKTIRGGGTTAATTTTTSAVKRKRNVAQVAVPATPPAPSLTPSAAQLQAQAQAQAQAQQGQQQAQAPVQSSSAPVAVSGGS